MKGAYIETKYVNFGLVRRTILIIVKTKHIIGDVRISLMAKEIKHP